MRSEITLKKKDAQVIKQFHFNNFFGKLDVSTSSAKIYTCMSPNLKRQKLMEKMESYVYSYISIFSEINRTIETERPRLRI